MKSRWYSLYSKVVASCNRFFATPALKARYQLTNAEYNLTFAELARLIAAATLQRDRVLLRLMIETGMRRSEVAALTHDAVDATRALITIRNGKGLKTRFVPVTHELAQQLLSLVDTSSRHIFRSRTGGPLSLRQVNRIVAAAGNRAGVANPNPKYRSVTCHLLRHSFARHWKDSGGSIETLSKLMGHASLATTWNEYGTESLSDICRNYRKTAKKMFSREKE